MPKLNSFYGLSIFYYPFGIFWRLLNKLLYEEIADTKGVKLLNKVTNLNLNITEEFEYIKGVIRICMSKKNRQHNGQKKKYKRTNSDLQNIHIKQKIE